MIQYEQTQHFYLLLLIPLMVLGYVLFSLWKKRVLKLLASAKMIDHIAPERSSFKGWLKQILFWLGWAFICLGLVNPQIGTELETVKREGVDLVFAIDVSKSMLAEDIAPNRLEKAKRLAGELINQLVSDRVGIIAYASSAIPHLPITTDYAAARLFLSSLDTNMISSQGTAISAAMRLAETYFDDENQTNRVVCIISDGEDHGDDALVAASRAAQLGVTFFTVIVGTEKAWPKGESFMRPNNITIKILPPFKSKDKSTLTEKAYNKELSTQTLKLEKMITKALKELENK